LSLFGDRHESVYAHYNHEIRKNMGAGARIAELEAQVATLRGELDSARASVAAPSAGRPFSWLQRDRSKK
jgi:hypothetical protein